MDFFQLYIPNLNLCHLDEIWKWRSNTNSGSGGKCGLLFLDFTQIQCVESASCIIIKCSNFYVTGPSTGNRQYFSLFFFITISSLFIYRPKLCRLCFKSFFNLKWYLMVSHSVPNKEELMKYGNARSELTFIHMKKEILCLSIFCPHLFYILYSWKTDCLDCPVCDKTSLGRLDKHLQDTHYIKAEESVNAK